MRNIYNAFKSITLCLGLLILGSADLQAQTQIPMPGHNTTYTGYSRGFYFTAPIDMDIVSLKAPTDATSTGLQAFEVLVFPGTSITATPTQAGYWRGVGATDSVDTNIFIAKGTLIGIIGHRYNGSVTQTNFTAMNSYGTATSVNIDGNTVALGRFGWQDNLGRGASNGSNLINATSGSIGRVLVYWQHPNAIDVQPLALDEPKGGCGLGKSESVSITFENIGDTLFKGDTVFLSYKVGSGTSVNETLVLGSDLLPKAKMSYSFTKKHDFSTTTVYDVEITASAANDGTTANDKITRQVAHTQTVSSFPYTVGWENGRDGWFTEPIMGPDHWELGSPSQTNLSAAHGGTNAWVTDLDANYQDEADMVLNSPCFNLGKIDNPNLVFWLRFDTEKNYDGMVLEHSLDGGASWRRVDSTMTNQFYNDTSSNLVLGAPMWSGDNGKWILYSTVDAAASKESNVRYRFRFASGAGKNAEGVAIDDFIIREAPKTDAGVIAIHNPETDGCGNTTDSIAVIIKNYGIQTIDSIPVHFNSTGDISVSTMIDTFFGSISPGSVDTLYFRARVNTAKGGTMNMKAYTQFGTDNETINDSFKSITTLFPIPTASFSASDACLGSSVNFSNNSASGNSGAITYAWNFGDGGSATNKSPGHIYTKEGKYQVVLTVTSVQGNCDIRARKTVNVTPIPKAKFSVTTGCEGIALQFSDSSKISSGSITTYDWDFGDNSSSNKQNPTHLYSTAGTYKVRLTVESDGGCSDFVVVNTDLYETPKADFSTTNVCESESFAFTNSSIYKGKGTVSYQWNFGDGNSSTRTDPNHQYSTSGSYAVDLIATSSDGCIDTNTQTAMAYPNPVSSFTFSDQCEGDTTKFTNTSTVSSGKLSSYQWNFGSGISAAKDADAVLGSAGNHDVELTVVTDNGCEDVSKVSVEIFELPNPGFTADDACAADSVSFANTSTTTSSSISYTWNLGDGNTSSDEEPKHPYAAPGKYTIEVSAETAEGCENQFSDEIEIFSLPTTNFTADNVCTDEEFKPVNTSTAASGDFFTNAWDFGDGSKSTAKEPRQTYTAAGTYTITLVTTTQNNCSNSVDAEIEVYALPDATFASGNMGNGRYSFTPTDANLSSYSWDFGDGNTSTDKNPEHKYSTEKGYIVSLTTVNADGCEKTETISLDVTTNILNPAAKYALQVYPNPFKENTSISYKLNEQSNVLLEVYDATGKRVTQLARNEQSAGEYTYNFHSQISDGVFLVRLSVNGETQMKQIIQNK